MNDEYLEHHGVLGMKWGIRRYQNADGSYTAAGRKRYGLDLDTKDKSRANIAKIRRGEAQRRLDVAKVNNPTNTVRIAELQGRLRTAKKLDKNMKKIEKGAKLAAKGQTIRGNRTKMALTAATIRFGRPALAAALTVIKYDKVQRGEWTPEKERCAQMINKYGQYALMTAGAAYIGKKTLDNRNLRAYNTARQYNLLSAKRVGSDEYHSRVKKG